nr:hypothetical protein [Tanacetum cinerariifolium]
MQTQTSNTLYNAIIEAGSKDHPPMLAPGSSDTTTKKYMETYKNVSQDIRDQLNAEAEAGESINVQDLETNLLGIWKIHVTGWARETIDIMVVQKSKIQCYNCKEFGYVARECQKPKRAKDKTYHREKMLLCKQEEAGIQLNAEQADWKDDTDDESDDQELEAHYMYMAKLQEVIPDAADNSRPIFDTKPVQQVQPNDNYNVFAIESEHHEQSQSIHDTYPIEQDEHNVIIDSLDMSYDKDQINQNDGTDDLDNEHQETISILTQQKETQIKLYKSREDKELDKVIALENKVK